MQAEALASQVVLIVKSALATAMAPVFERLSASEAKLSVLGDVRDRVVAIETKQAIPFVSVPDPAIADVRDRLVALETKWANYQPPALESPELAARLAAVEQTTNTLRGVDVTAEIEAARESLRSHLSADFAQKEAALRERIAVLETKAPIPGPHGEGGPPGRDGKDGADGREGKDGKDGADGLGFDDLAVEQKDERTFLIKAARGERVKVIGTVTMPFQIYRGVFSEGKSYEHGDEVTWGGSHWHCNESTVTKPDSGSKAWTLVVKRGRDGKDGKDAPGALPVVSLGRPS